MGHVQPRHRKVIDQHLQAGESVVAVMHTNQGKATPTTGSGAMGSTSGGGLTRYMEENGVVHKGVSGVYDLFDTWLVLTDRRLAFFAGSWFTFRPGPKKHILDMPPDSFSLRWRPEKGVKDYWLVHFTFPDDEHLVVMAEPDEDTQAFFDAIGDRAQPI